MKKQKNLFIIIFIVSCLVVPCGYVISKQAKGNQTLAGNLETTENEEPNSEETNREEQNREEQNHEEQNREDQNREDQNSEEEMKGFQSVDKSYFDDALFIGDSRTLGISEYGTLENADYFTSSGMSVYNLEKDRISVKDIGRVSLNELLETHSYGKIYVMLGINELGYEQSKTVQKYRNLIEKLRSMQPEAILYIEANLHVTAKRSMSDEIFNNTNISHYNEELKKIADQKKIFYLDVNEMFDDAEGNLNQDYSNDDTHPLGKYYAKWCDWLMEHAIVQ